MSWMGKGRSSIDALCSITTSTAHNHEAVERDFLSMAGALIGAQEVTLRETEMCDQPR